MRLGPRAAFGRADSRMQRAPRRAWHEAVRVEAVFLEGEPMVVPVQIADAIVLHPVPQDQILCAGRRESDRLARIPVVRRLAVAWLVETARRRWRGGAARSTSVAVRPSGVGSARVHLKTKRMTACIRQLTPAARQTLESRLSKAAARSQCALPVLRNFAFSQKISLDICRIWNIMPTCRETLLLPTFSPPSPLRRGDKLSRCWRRAAACTWARSS